MKEDIKKIIEIIKRLQQQKQEGIGSPETSLALAKLEQAVYWLRKAILRSDSRSK